MTAFRPKLWTGVSAAILLGASAAACSKTSEPQTPTAASEEAPAPAPAPAAAVGEGGEAGEAGAASAYAAIPAASKAALQVAHLRGFFLIARKQTEGADAAAALAGQGMLEVFEKDPAAFKAAGVDEAKLRKAAETGSNADLDAAIASLDATFAKAGGDPAAIAKGMVGIATGLYQGVITDGAVDPTEYQHSLGAALSAQAVAARDAGRTPKLAAARADLDKLVKLWPGAVAPEKPTPVGEVLAQGSRVELALS